MAAVSFRSFKPAQFEQFSQQIREQQGSITPQQAEQVAQHFQVPLQTVLALREELLAAATKAAEQVSQQTREQREAGDGGRQPLGMAQVKDVGVNPFMFKQLSDEQIRRRGDTKGPDQEHIVEAKLLKPDTIWWNDSDLLPAELLFPGPMKDSVEVDGVTFTRKDVQDLLAIVAEQAETPPAKQTEGSEQVAGASADFVWNDTPYQDWGNRYTRNPFVDPQLVKEIYDKIHDE